ncbi:hypothetical protein BKA61DRAFT_656885 [Leptodontidium sp. MPI-SDFR-AT-0119]|nr:hypothetical protein BKA61DRAFT_656885 [Leptodontidium sp. MPI-SDFR-AT-0119]
MPKLDTFTCFPRLPLEIRLKIWRAIAKLPRVVMLSEVRYDNMGTERWETRTSVVLQKIKTGQPAVIQICHESRSECLTFYQLVLGTRCQLEVYTRIGSTCVVDVHEPTIYFNNLKDTLYVCCPSLPGHTKNPDKSYWLDFWGVNPAVKGLKSVAFNADELDMMSSYEEWDDYRPIESIIDFFEAHREVEEVILVVKGFNSVPTKGDFEFVELDQNFVNNDSANTDIIQRHLIGIFNMLKEVHESEAKKKEHGRTHRKVMDTLLGWHEEEIENPAPPEPEDPFIYPKIKIMGITRNGTRI